MARHPGVDCRRFTVKVEDLQLREVHWVLADLVGKGGHVSTVPIPGWVGSAVAG